MGRGYFQKLKPEMRKLIGQKGGQRHRSQSLERAWSDQELLRRLYDGGDAIKELAKAYNVSERSMFRIIRGR